MSTSLLLQVREQVKAKLAEKDTLLKEQEVRISEADAIKAEAEKRGEGDLDPQEAARFRELTGQVSDISKRLKEIDAETEALEERDAQLVTFEEARDNAAKAAKTWADRSSNPAEVSTVARVKSEARTYSAEAEKRQGPSP
jgi:predicted nuclease with TOPRIM domain